MASRTEPAAAAGAGFGRRPSVVLIVADSLRADRLSDHGCPRATSPFLASLAESGVRCTEFFTPATPTEPACTSLLTGQFPLTHGVVAPSRRCRLARRAPWLPSLLAARGWDTAAVDDLGWRQHFGRGFQTLLYRRARDDEYVDGFALNRLALPWLAARRRGRPFFLYVRYGDTHTPYWPPPRYRHLFYEGDPTRTNVGSLDAFHARPLKPYLLTKWLRPAAQEWPGAAGDRIEDLDWCRAQYDASVRALDDAIAELADGLARLGLAEQTLLAVIGDHGESLGEHGIFFEHHGLYDGTLRAPLILHGPGLIPAGRRVDATVMTPDVAPTILDLLGEARPAGMEGRSLASRLAGNGDGPGHARVVASEATWMCKWAYRAGGYKLIVAREPDFYGRPPLELYDLAADPAEERNLAEIRPDLCRALHEEFEAWLARRLRAVGRRRDPVAAHGSMHRRFLGPPTLRRRLRRMIRDWWRRRGGPAAGVNGREAGLRTDGHAPGELDGHERSEGQRHPERHGDRPPERPSPREAADVAGRQGDDGHADDRRP